MKKTSIFALIILSIIINLGFKVESYAYGPYNYFFYVTGKEIVNPVGEYKYIYTGYDKNTAKKTYYSNLELNVDEVYTFDIPEGTYNTIDEHITRNVFDVYEKKNPCVGYNDKNGNFHTYLLDNDNTIYNEKKYEWYNGNRVYIDYSNLYELCDNFLDFNYEEYCKNNSLLKNTSLITTLIIIHENEKEYLFGVVYKENYDEDIVINNSLNGWEYRLFYDFDTGEGQDAVIIEYNKNETDLVITDTVLINNTPHKITAIGHKAFTGNKNIINLQVPDSIDYIYNEAFKNCNNLEKVVLLNGNCDIAPSAFEGCSNLTTFTMPKSEYRILIYEGAFKNCSNLEQIDFIANTNWINEYTFYGCDSLKSIIIPECIEQIGFNAFQNCKNLESVTFLNKETCLGLNAFKGCENLKDIYLYKDLKGYLNSDFFENLDDINIHYLDDEQLVLTENGAIKDDLLFTIISDNEVMVRYKDDKYSNQLGLDTVVIPESIIINGKKYKVTTIEKNALPNTKNVYLPKTIKNFYMGAFYFHTYDNIYYDGSLEDFYKINKLSDDIYGNGMFGNDANGLPKKCPIFNDGSTGNYNDIKLYYKNNIGEYELYNRAIIIDKIKYVKLLSEDGVIALGLTNDGEFYDYNEDTLYILDKVVINNKEYAVTCAKDFTGYCKKVVLPSTVEIARINLRGIKEIYCNILVNTELEVGTDIHFYKTKTEIEKYYSENGGYYDYLNGKYNLFYSDQKVIKNIVIDGIMYYIVYNEETKKYETNFYVLDDTLTDIVIPDTVIIDGREYNVTGGDSETFERVRSTVKSIKLGKYVLLNDKNYNSFLRFDQFESLEHIYVDNDNYCMIDGIIYSKDKKKLVYAINSILPDKIIIPEGVEIICQQAFQNCTNVKEVVFPSTLINIELEAFQYANIKNIILNEGLEFIGVNAFSKDYDENDLVSKIYLPSSIKKIDSGAFEVINVRDIDFSETEVIYNGTQEDWDKIVVYDYILSKDVKIEGNNGVIINKQAIKINLEQSINSRDTYYYEKIDLDVYNNLDSYLVAFDFTADEVQILKNKANWITIAKFTEELVSEFNFWNSTYGILESKAAYWPYQVELLEKNVYMLEYLNRINTSNLSDKLLVEQLVSEYNSLEWWQTYYINKYDIETYNKLFNAYNGFVTNITTSKTVSGNIITVIGVLNSIDESNIELNANIETNSLKVNEISNLIKSNSLNNKIYDEPYKIFNIDIINKDEPLKDVSLKNPIEIIIEVSEEDYLVTNNVWHIHDDNSLEKIENVIKQYAYDKNLNKHYYIKFFTNSFSYFVLTKETEDISSHKTKKSKQKNELNKVTTSNADKQIILHLDSKKINIFGEEKENDVMPIVRNDRTMLPIRIIAESLGAIVCWVEQWPDKVYIQKDNTSIIIILGSNIATVNGQEYMLDSVAFAENNRTYLPVRFISETLGAEVIWDESNPNEVIINAK